MRSVLVTGASRGLGLAIACKLARGGYRVVALARSRSDALAAAMEERARGGETGALHHIAFDLARVEAIGALAKAVRRDYGPLYGLVNNAGVGFEGMLALMPD